MSTQTEHLSDGHLSEEQWATTLSEGHLDGGLNEAIRAHLQDCAQCRTERQRWQQVLGQMRSQVTASADRPAAFWSWQLQNTLKRARPRRVSLAPALAGTLALLALALLLLQRPATTLPPDSQTRAAAVAAPVAVIPSPSRALTSTTVASAPASAASIPMVSNPDDAALMAEIQRTLQGPPAALQPAALLAQELLSAQMAATPGTDSTGSTGSKGEVQ